MLQEISIAGGDTAKPINLKKRIDLITSRYGGPESPRFLDCGCGAGEYVDALSQVGWNASGIEFLEPKIEQARRLGRGPDKVSQGDIENLNFPAKSFDVVLFNEVLEHVPSDEKALAEAGRVLKPDGHLFIFSPNRLYPFESHGVFLKGRKKKLPVWVPFIPYIPLPIGHLFFDYWARNYWPLELQKMVTKADFEIVETGYVWQTFEGISGNRSSWLQALRPTLRAISAASEQVPLLRTLGVSQFIHARQPR